MIPVPPPGVHQISPRSNSGHVHAARLAGVGSARLAREPIISDKLFRLSRCHVGLIAHSDALGGGARPHPGMDEDTIRSVSASSRRILCRTAADVRLALLADDDPACGAFSHERRYGWERRAAVGVLGSHPSCCCSRGSHRYFLADFSFLCLRRGYACPDWRLRRRFVGPDRSRVCARSCAQRERLQSRPKVGYSLSFLPIFLHHSPATTA